MGEKIYFVEPDRLCLCTVMLSCRSKKYERNLKTMRWKFKFEDVVVFPHRAQSHGNKVRTYVSVSSTVRSYLLLDVTIAHELKLHIVVEKSIHLNFSLSFSNWHEY